MADPSGAPVPDARNRSCLSRGRGRTARLAPTGHPDPPPPLAGRGVGPATRGRRREMQGRVDGRKAWAPGKTCLNPASTRVWIRQSSSLGPSAWRLCRTRAARGRNGRGGPSPTGRAAVVVSVVARMDHVRTAGPTTTSAPGESIKKGGVISKRRRDPGQEQAAGHDGLAREFMLVPC